MVALHPGPLNAITDVPGVRIGQADDARLASGVTAIVFEEPAVAAVDVRGGAPGTSETDLLDPERTVPAVDAIALSGGSAFGLDASAGVKAALVEVGRGFVVGPARVPIVPAAIIFDLLNGGDKDWGRFPPYRDLGYAAASAALGGAEGAVVRQGSVGAGLGALAATMKGGLGTASSVIEHLGVTVGAIVVVNAAGSATVGQGPHFWASPFEIGDEFGGLGPAPKGAAADDMPIKALPGGNTTIALVAVDAILTKAETRALAVAANTGLGRALVPAHTPSDGDTVFAAATGRRAIEGQRLVELAWIGHVAANTLSRAIARGVYEAAALPFDGASPSWRDRFAPQG